MDKDSAILKRIQLPVSERAALARRLIESLDACEAGDYEAEWAQEAEKRYSEYRQGLVEGRPGKRVIREAKARLG